jgi:hypothetical protein
VVVVVLLLLLLVAVFMAGGMQGPACVVARVNAGRGGLLHACLSAVG